MSVTSGSLVCAFEAAIRFRMHPVSFLPSTALCEILSTPSRPDDVARNCVLRSPNTMETRISKVSLAGFNLIVFAVLAHAPNASKAAASQMASLTVGVLRRVFHVAHAGSNKLTVRPQRGFGLSPDSNARYRWTVRWSCVRTRTVPRIADHCSIQPGRKPRRISSSASSCATGSCLSVTKRGGHLAPRPPPMRKTVQRPPAQLLPSWTSFLLFPVPTLVKADT